jgi:WD40 repeat protein
VPDHELLRRIGGGSYGEVWLARSLLGTYRAVKVVYRTDFDHDHPFEREFDGIKRFEPISRLHETQVDILHVGRGTDCFYYVMELADGLCAGQQIDPERYVPRTLRSEIQRRGTLPFEECLEVALALTTALEHLHSHHLVHRDIKPSNIIFIGGAPKLADIGLVTGLDATRSYVGTQGFIPPEGAGTQQADFYSLGKVLYEAATGKDRQDFPEPAPAWAESTGEQTWLEFHEILLKACEPDPRRRYQSAAELRAELELLRGGKSVRHLRTVERRLSVLTRFGLLSSGLLLLAAGAYLFSVHETHQAQKEAWRADHEAARAQRAERDARERMLDSYMFQAQAHLTASAGRRFDSLEALKKAAAMGLQGESLIKLRNQAIACLALADFQTAKEWSIPSNTVLTTFDPALERFAYATDHGDVGVCRTADAKELIHLPGDGVPAKAALAFSPDGQLLALFHGTKDLDLCVWQLERQAALIKTTHMRGCCFDFSPDSHCLALVQHNGPILLCDLGSGQWTNRLKEVSFPTPRMVAFSPDGHQLAVAVGPFAEVRDVRDDTVIQTFSHPDVVMGLAWHENLLATACADEIIRVWDTVERTQCATLVGHQSAVTNVAFNHRGDLLLSCGLDKTTRLWDTLNWRLIVTQLGVDFRSRIPFTSDDKLFGYNAGAKLGICNVAPGRECRKLSVDPKLATQTGAVDFSPDGRHLVSAHNDGARIWDLATGKLLMLLPDTNVTCVSFARQGSFIFTTSPRDGIKLRGPKMWPFDATEAGQFHYGPPAFFTGAPLSGAPFSLSSDGRTLATISWKVLVFDTVTGQARLHLGNAPNSHFYRCALSSNSQWLAAAAMPQTFVRVWNLDDFNIFHDLKCLGVSCLAFSADTQRLITGSACEYCSWDLQSWKCAFVSLRSAVAHDPCIALARDVRFMAVTDSAFTVRLLDTATGRELATFGMPEPQVISCLAFSPDGNQLAVGGQTPAIYIWDLRLIRQQLAQMNLDWD